MKYQHSERGRDLFHRRKPMLSVTCIHWTLVMLERCVDSIAGTPIPRPHEWNTNAIGCRMAGQY